MKGSYEMASHREDLCQSDLHCNCSFRVYPNHQALYQWLKRIYIVTGMRTRTATPGGTLLRDWVEHMLIRWKDNTGDTSERLGGAHADL